MKPEVGKLYNAGGILYECIDRSLNEWQFKAVGMYKIPSFWAASYVFETWTEATRKDILDAMEVHQDRIALHYIEIEKHEDGISELKGWWDVVGD